MPLSLVPKPAAFVVIRIDPVATVATLNDPLATAAAKKLPSKQYVAYVSKAINAFDWKVPHHTYAIHLASPAVPEPCEADGIGADMYTPVLPAATHPLGRAPLRTTKPLPWPCYQPSFMRSVVRVPVRLEDDASAVLLDPAEAVRHRRILAGEDGRRDVSLGASTRVANSEGPGYAHLSDLDEYTGDFTCPIDADCFDSDEDRFYEATVKASRPPDTCIVVDVSYDLSQVDEVPDPLNFFEEKRRLRELEKESRARKTRQTTISKPDLTAEEVQHGASEAIDLLDYFKAVWIYPGFPKRLQRMHIAAVVLREVATRAGRLSAYLGRIKGEGLAFLQGWKMTVRFV
ncbi:hypothetical protein B0H15DRAFT_119068 [Mycena belliarum]|uniref:Uncharacterized protein n=1 Tax=Mycena belliarum TaxID=1033014 RepID=A0AAD6TRX9_9AGAR|nr:hypothetical protein B0H15DRAFT_119068 [Mycena belliae]